MKIKPEAAILGIILLSGFVLRIWGINFGLPYLFHQDEPMVVTHALAYGSGDMNPHYFAIPPLTSYILFFIYGIYYIFGKLTGVFDTPEAFASGFFNDPSVFYILGRLFIGAIPGVLCIFFVYKLYKRLFESYKGALFSAAIMAVGFLNVENSHYIYVDTLMVLFLVLSVLQLIKTYTLPTFKNYILSGILIGVITAVKYNAVLVIAAFFIMHLLSRPNRKSKLTGMYLISGIILIPLVFFIANPYAILDFKFFINALLRQSDAEFYIGWIHHVGYSLKEGIGLFVLILGALGMISMVIKDWRTGAIFLSFPAVFYLHLVFFSQRFPRYALPLIPFLSIAAGYFIFEIIPIGKGIYQKIILLFCSLILAPLIVKSIKLDLLFASKDTRIQAAEWINNNIDTKNSIAVDHTFFRPVIFQDTGQLEEKYAITNRQGVPAGLKDKKLGFMLKAQKGKKSYRLFFLSPNPQSQGQFLTTVPSLEFDLKALKNKRIDYISVNNTNRQNNTDVFYEKLIKEAIPVIFFSPYKDGKNRMSYDKIATTCMPAGSKELYSRTMMGPAIEIYKLEK